MSGMKALPDALPEVSHGKVEFMHAHLVTVLHWSDGMFTAVCKKCQRSAAGSYADVVDAMRVRCR